MDKIKIGLYGYGNIARGVEAAIRQNDDMELKAVFTRRDPNALKINTPNAIVYSADSAPSHADEIDVLVMCGGSATDLPAQTPALAKYFNVIDTFDTHKRIPEHFTNVDETARLNNKTAMISVGWDPGMFSLMRIYGEAILPDGNDYTFWGRGVSQGHSDAVRRIKGVIDARQYTIPVESAVESVRNGQNPTLTARQKHTREVYVVAEEGADKDRITHEIVTMKNYFDEYDTTVHFISMEEMKQNHSGLPHGGMVIRCGVTGLNKEHKHTIEYSLKLDSNPEFTACVIVAYARAVARMNKDGIYGCKTVMDVAPIYLSKHSPDELRAHML